MAQPKFTAYALESLPTTDIDVGGLYFIKLPSENKFSIFIRNNANDGWFDLGLVEASVDEINGLTGDVKIDLEFTQDGILKVKATGDGNSIQVTEIDLDARYYTNDQWNSVTNLIVYTDSVQTIEGEKTFSTIPLITSPPTSNTHATNKLYVDTQIANLIASGVVIKGEIDASPNPPFPGDSNTKKGSSWIISKSGKIGGVNGRQVDVGNMIIALEDGDVVTLPGDYADVKDNWAILQSDLDQATEIKKGFARIATQQEVDEGELDNVIVTPLKLKSILGNLEETYIRYDKVQDLTPAQKLQARYNIGASSMDDGDKNFIYEQNFPSATWEIVHNLNKKPSVTIVDSANTEVEGQVTINDDTTVLITFNAPFSGTAILN